MTTTAIRITLPNEPGALARAATAMSDLGVNIVDVDVHELDGESVVDEIVVWLPDDVTPAHLRAALLDAGCLCVESLPASHHTSDAIVRCLDGLARCIPQSVRQRDALMEMVSALMPGCTARVIGRSESPEAAAAIDQGVPVCVGVRGGERCWTVVLPYPEDAPEVGVELTRVRMRPSATEIARARALLRVHRMIVGAVPSLTSLESG